MSDRAPDDDDDAGEPGDELPEDSPARAVVDTETEDLPEPSEPA